MVDEGVDVGICFLLNFKVLLVGKAELINPFVEIVNLVTFECTGFK